MVTNQKLFLGFLKVTNLYLCLEFLKFAALYLIFALHYFDLIYVLPAIFCLLSVGVLLKALIYLKRKNFQGIKLLSLVIVFYGLYALAAVFQEIFVLLFYKAPVSRHICIVLSDFRNIWHVHNFIIIFYSIITNQSTFHGIPVIQLILLDFIQFTSSMILILAILWNKQDLKVFTRSKSSGSKIPEEKKSKW